MSEPSSQFPIPVTIIAGFLGAGKTTLLNRILQAQHGRRVAVLVNDFGELDIDARLLEVGPAGRMVSLPNGCICCTLAGSLVKTVKDLADLPEPPEHILIEASGVSTPENLTTLLDVPVLETRVALDSTITLLDAEHVRKLARVVSFLENQIRTADIILLNKADLVSPAALAGLEDWVREIAPQARLLTTRHADAPLELILAAGRERAAPRLPAEHGHSHSHDQVYNTWSYTTDQPFSRQGIEAVMAGLPATVYRAKGILYLADAPAERHILQVVGPRVRLTGGGPWDEQPPRSDMVFIGEPGALDPAELQASLDRCISTAL